LPDHAARTGPGDCPDSGFYYRPPFGKYGRWYVPFSSSGSCLPIAVTTIERPSDSDPESLLTIVDKRVGVLQ
jgi:hypothetical protein